MEVSELDILNPHYIISASTEEAQFLQLLFPQLNQGEFSDTYDCFVTRDLVSQNELRWVRSSPRQFIIISNILFDIKVTKEDLEQLALKFTQVYFKSRKKSIKIPEHTEPLEFLSDYIYGINTESEESFIIELFDTVGTRAFEGMFLKHTDGRPTRVVIRSVLTFLSKLESPTSLFYKKAASRLYQKYKQNYPQAAENLVSYTHSQSEPEERLSFIKFHSDLFQT